MAGAEVEVRNELMDKWFNDVDFTQADTFVSLHTADPSDGTLDEVSGGSYARQQVHEAGDASTPQWNTAASGLVDNSEDIDFNDMPATTVTHVAIVASATEGTDDVLWSGALDANKTTESGDTLRFPAGDLNLQIT